MKGVFYTMTLGLVAAGVFFGPMLGFWCYEASTLVPMVGKADDVTLLAVIMFFEAMCIVPLLLGLVYGHRVLPPGWMKAASVINLIGAGYLYTLSVIELWRIGILVLWSLFWFLRKPRYTGYRRMVA